MTMNIAPRLPSYRAPLHNIALLGLMLALPLVPVQALAQSADSAPTVSLPAADSAEPPAAAELGAAPAGSLPGFPGGAAAAAPETTTAAEPSSIDAAAAALAGNADSAPSVSSMSAGSSTDPCPEPKSALANTPDDLAKVQEDIERFTLCVERAQLLDRLNESAAKTDETIDSALGLSAGPMEGGMMPPSVPTGEMAPVNESMLGGADVTPTGAASAPVPDGIDAIAGAAQPQLPPDWQVREVFGASGQLYARLNGPKGELVRVKTGDRLPSDGGTVTLVSAEGVTVRKDKDSKTLDWAAQ